MGGARFGQAAENVTVMLHNCYNVTFFNDFLGSFVTLFNNIVTEILHFSNIFVTEAERLYGEKADGERVLDMLMGKMKCYRIVTEILQTAERTFF